MEPVAWVEFLGLRGQVLQRHSAYAWPIRVGHHYVGDMVVDDPQFPDIEFHLTEDENGSRFLRFAPANAMDVSAVARPLRLNGKTLKSDETSRERLALHGNDILECGTTRLRIRLRGHSDAPDSATAKPLWWQTWTSGVCIAGIAVAWFALFGYANSLEENTSELFKEPFIYCCALVGWWMAWATISRILIGFSHAREHLFWTASLFAIFPNFTYAASLLSFGTGIRDFGWAGQFLQLLAVGCAIYSHLSLIKPANLTVSGLRSLCLLLIVWLWPFGGINILFPSEQQIMSYDASMWPSSVVVAHGSPSSDLLNDLDAVKGKVDKLAEDVAARHSQ